MINPDRTGYIYESKQYYPLERTPPLRRNLFPFAAILFILASSIVYFGI